MTKICIFGAGAIGGYMAHALIKAGADVSLIARGPHLEGLRDKGLTLIKEGSAETLPVKATDTPEELGPQDYVISALKAHSVAPRDRPVQTFAGGAHRAGAGGQWHTLVVFLQGGQRQCDGKSVAGNLGSRGRTMGCLWP